VHEFTAADRDTHMRRSLAHRLEEDEIAGLHIILAYLLAEGVLLARLARQRCAVLRVHPLDKAAAVEAARRLAAAVSILSPSEGQGRGDQLRWYSR